MPVLTRTTQYTCKTDIAVVLPAVAGSALALLLGETDGFAINALTPGGTVAVIDTGTPANNKSDVLLNASNLVQSGTSPKRVLWNNGTLQIIPAGQIAQEWDGSRFGILIEPTATNLILQSQTFDSATWGKTDTTITPDSIAAPDGTSTADLATQGVAGTAAITQAITITADTINSYSFFVKYGNNDWLRLVVFNGGDSINAWFNLNTGVAGSVSNTGVATGAAATLRSIGNGWYRCTVTGNLNGGITAASVRIRSVDGDSSLVNTNNATYYLWGAQNDPGVATSSYIPTTTGAVTRNPDAIGCNVSTYPHSNTQGTFILWVKPRIINQVVPARFYELNDGTTDEVTTLVETTADSPNSFGLSITDGAVGQVSQGITKAGVSSLAGNKVASFYTLNDSGVLADNGAEVLDSACTMPTVTTFTLGYASLTAAREFNGYIYQMVYVPRRMTTVEMQTRTAP